MDAAYLWHDEISGDKGVLPDETKYHFTPPVIAFVSMGCTRCPPFLKRDDRKTINNGRNDNPNYGYCYRQVCGGSGILIEGNKDDNYKDQGECKPCPPGKVVRNGFCRDCLDYETTQRNP